MIDEILRPNKGQSPTKPSKVVARSWHSCQNPGRVDDSQDNVTTIAAVTIFAKILLPFSTTLPKFCLKAAFLPSNFKIIS